MTAYRFHLFGTPNLRLRQANRLRSGRARALVCWPALPWPTASRSAAISFARCCGRIGRRPRPGRVCVSLLVDLRHDFGHASDVFEIATDGAISCNGTADRVRCCRVSPVPPGGRPADSGAGIRPAARPVHRRAYRRRIPPSPIGSTTTAAHWTICGARRQRDCFGFSSAKAIIGEAWRLPADCCPSIRCANWPTSR